LVDGLILPNLMQHHEPSPGGTQPEGIRTKNGRGASGKRRSSPAARDGCLFLSAQGRCAIHPYRPGICRLYPLGRYYHTDREFAYIVQKEECTGREKTPVRVREWLGIDDLERYEAYILDWHAFKKSVEKAAACLTDRSRDSVQRYILQIFFVHPYRTEMEFYPQYGARMEVCREALREIL
ncbi:MAG: YkgJ family cysteine cluster protein, partial [Eubacteriales bacterium]|nr:YkgJ family cysteine cluster protein [Eubacteriales bacterium]